MTPTNTKLAEALRQCRKSLVAIIDGEGGIGLEAPEVIDADEALAAHDAEQAQEQAAQAVPDAQSTLPDSGPADVGFVRGWNACREAVLAAAHAAPAPAPAPEAQKPHLFEFWWERYMPNATQVEAWEAWQAAPRADGVGVVAPQAQAAGQASRGFDPKQVDPAMRVPFCDQPGALAQRQPLTEPPPGLLMSMAIRYDHALGCPGYYDSELFKAQGVTHAQRLEGTLRTMRQLWEEVTGRGFYSPEREADYATLAAATTGEQHG